MIKKDLENKAWYRAIKVLYIASFLISILFVSFVAYSAKPYKEPNEIVQKITCNDGKHYQPKKRDVSVQTDGNMYESDDADARKLCQYGPKDYGNANLVIPPEKNYTVELTSKTVGSWQTLAEIALIGFGIVFVAFVLFRRIFLYIVVG